jgi:hypothetical protein
MDLNKRLLPPILKARVSREYLSFLDVTDLLGYEDEQEELNTVDDEAGDEK